MNIIEAIKSGRPFRRKGWDDYLVLDGDYFLKNMEAIKKELLLADDWEVEEPSLAACRDQSRSRTHSAPISLGGEDLTN
jgi:hypothetical protein